ncbi:MAG: TPM domain-containing protein [Armatimonadota bacterium]
MSSVKDFFSASDREKILQAVKDAENRTSGEIRIRIEEKAEENLLDQARKAFEALGLRKTELRNGVLFFIAVKDKKFAVLGDDGINEKVPGSFWEDVKNMMRENFKKGLFAQGITEGINLAGEQLAAFFPHEKKDVNELPDAISFSGEEE